MRSHANPLDIYVGEPARVVSSTNSAICRRSVFTSYAGAAGIRSIGMPAVANCAIDKFILRDPVGPLVGAVIEFDHQRDGRGIRVGQREIDVLLRNLGAIAGFPSFTGTADQVAHANLGADDQMIGQGAVEGPSKKHARRG